MNKKSLNELLTAIENEINSTFEEITNCNKEIIKEQKRIIEDFEDSVNVMSHKIIRTERELTDLQDKLAEFRKSLNDCNSKENLKVIENKIESFKNHEMSHLFHLC